MSAGITLKEARERRNIPLSKVSEDLFIRTTYLQAIENDRPEILPSPTQGRGFVRMYAEYLGFDSAEILKEWGQVVPETTPLPIAAEETAQKKKSPFKKFANPVPKAEEEPATEQKETDPVQSIYEAIGAELKTRRESLALTFDDAERHTLVRSNYLEWMENGDFESLPSSVQVRGMLNNYADFLNLDVDDIMLRYANALQLASASRAIEEPGKAASPKTSKQKPVKKVGKLRQFITPDLFVGLTVLLGMAAIIVYSAVTISEYKAKASQGTATMEMILIYQTQTEAMGDFSTTQEPVAITPTPVFSAQLPAADAGAEIIPTDTVLPTTEGNIVSNRPIQIFIEATQRTYLKVVSDGNVVYNGRTAPGNTYPFDASELIQITAGNAAAINITYNQQRLGALGTLGETLALEFTRDSMMTPTAMYSPSPSATPEVTETVQQQRATPTITITPYIP